MRKFLALAVAVLGAVFLVASGTASAVSIVDLLTFQSGVDAAQAVDPTLAAPPNDGAHDFAVGGFEGTGNNQVGFSAHSDPLGGNPQGHLTQNVPQVRKDRFTVTCLAVLGNHAALGLTPADATTAQNFPNGRVFAVTDNGNPVGGQPVDTYAYYIDSASNCASYVGVGGFFTPVSGNIVVHDAD
jgi:hypothetical protein